MKKYFEIKNTIDTSIDHIKHMHPKLLLVLGHFITFCEVFRKECVITNIINKYPQSESNTHPQGRAFDASVHGWCDEDIKLCLRYMNDKAGNYGALSYKDGLANVVICHDIGLGKHLHFQVSPSYNH